MNGRDPSLTIPTLPSLSRGTGSPSFSLERSPPLEHDPPFQLRAGGLRVYGGHTRGVDAVRGHGSPLALGLAVEGAVTERSTLSPLGLERQLVVDGVEGVERVVAAPADPVAFFEWIVSDDVEIQIRWRLPVRGARWHAGDSGVVVASPAARRLYLLSRPATELSTRPHGNHELVVAARFDLRADEGVLIAIAEVAADADEARALRVMGRPHVAVPARRAAALRTLQSTLALDVPGDPVSEALDWAKLSLATETFEGGATARGGRLSERWLRVALAGLAVGSVFAARSMIRGVGAHEAGGPGGPGPDMAARGRAAAEGVAEDGRWLLLVARYLAWTGDLVLVKDQWARVVERADRVAREGSAAGDLQLDLRRRALIELAVAAEEVGDRALAKRVREAAGDAASTPELRGSWPGPSERSGGGHAAGGSGRSDVGLESAALVEEVVGRVLRVEPDASRGRLVLRPRLPSGWSRCAVRGLAVGEAVMEMEYRSDGGAHAWTVRQRHGRAPLTLIFEPAMPGVRVVAARVDGAAAELDAVAAEGRVQVAVQLVLDHERRVEVEIAEPDH